MKNLTLAIEDDLLERARAVAAERQTTVNAMVRAYLAKQAGEIALSERRREAARRLLALSRQGNGVLPEGWKPNREDAYAERLSRHEHPPLRGGGADE